MDGYMQIEGRFGDFEADLYRTRVRQAQPGARFVEIGSWKGRGAYCMAEAIRDAGKRIDFWCIDTWRGGPQAPLAEAVSDSLYETFLQNVQPLRQWIRPVRASSHAAADLFADRSLDFVFLNTTHEFTAALAEIRAWLPKIKPTGVLAGHVYRSQWLGALQAVETAFGRAAQLTGPCWIYSPTPAALPMEPVAA